MSDFYGPVKWNPNFPNDWGREEEETDFLLWLSSRLLKNMLAIKVYSSDWKTWTALLGHLLQPQTKGYEKSLQDPLTGIDSSKSLHSHPVKAVKLHFRSCAFPNGFWRNKNNNNIFHVFFKSSIFSILLLVLQQMVTLMIQLQEQQQYFSVVMIMVFKNLVFFLLKCAAKFENLPKISIFCEVFLFWKIIMQIHSRLFQTFFPNLIGPFLNWHFSKVIDLLLTRAKWNLG